MEERYGRFMWIETSCWTGLRCSLRLCFLSLSVLPILVSCLPAGSLISIYMVNNFGDPKTSCWRMSLVIGSDIL